LDKQKEDLLAAMDPQKTITKRPVHEELFTETFDR
jgi:hypothetical protein